MSDRSTIGRTGANRNPVCGYTKITSEFKVCFTDKFAERFRGVTRHAYEQRFDLRVVPEELNGPLNWKNSRRIFVNFLSDLFQAGVADEYISSMPDVMLEAEWPTYEVLPKRSERMQRLLNSKLRTAAQATTPLVWCTAAILGNSRTLRPLGHSSMSTPLLLASFAGPRCVWRWSTSIGPIAV